METIFEAGGPSEVLSAYHLGGADQGRLAVSRSEVASKGKERVGELCALRLGGLSSRKGEKRAGPELGSCGPQADRARQLFPFGNS